MDRILGQIVKALPLIYHFFEQLLLVALATKG